MTFETRKQVLENLRRIDWLASQITDKSKTIWLADKGHAIAFITSTTIRLIESEPNQTNKAA